MEIQGVQSDHIMLGHVDNAAIYFEPQVFSQGPSC